MSGSAATTGPRFRDAVDGAQISGEAIGPRGRLIDRAHGAGSARKAPTRRNGGPHWMRVRVETLR